LFLLVFPSEKKFLHFIPLLGKPFGIVYPMWNTFSYGHFGGKFDHSLDLKTLHIQPVLRQKISFFPSDAMGISSSTFGSLSNLYSLSPL